MAHLAHYREAHPLPFVITHWVNLVCMFLLIPTGFYIHFPFLPLGESVVRGVHVLCGFVIFANLVVRLVLAFFVSSSPTGGSRKQDVDFKTWLPQSDNRHQAKEWVRYYLFMRKTHPLGGKLSVPQKLSYLAIAPLLTVMFVTGVCIWGPAQGLDVVQMVLGLVGGSMAMRVIHYLLMFAFIIFCLIHIYLANIEGIAPTMLMLFRKEQGGLTYDPERHVIDGYDDLEK